MGEGVVIAELQGDLAVVMGEEGVGGQVGRVGAVGVVRAADELVERVVGVIDRLERGIFHVEDIGFQNDFGRGMACNSAGTHLKVHTHSAVFGCAKHSHPAAKPRHSSINGS